MSECILILVNLVILFTIFIPSLKVKFMILNTLLHCYRADLANLVNEAALLAGRQNKIVVEKLDFIQAVERSIAVSQMFSRWPIIHSN